MKLLRTLKQNIDRINRIRNADNMIYSYPKVKALENRVNLHVMDIKQTPYAYYDNGDYPYNLGDCLAYPIVEFLLDKKKLHIDQPVSKKKHLKTVGSGALASYQDATLWGTGVEFDGLRGAWWEKYWDAKHRKLDIRAVRGPLSREVFLKLGHQCPEVYGDPGILMPILYTPENLPTEKKDYGIIPQFTSEPEIRKYIPADRIISTNTNDFKAFIDKVCSCSMVYSSSLHGIILAEAYGVPAIFYRELHRNIDFKYRDYYASTGRFDVPMAATLVEAMKMTPPPLPDLRQMQQKLMEVFPYDLWES